MAYFISNILKLKYHASPVILMYSPSSCRFYIQSECVVMSRLSKSFLCFHHQTAVRIKHSGQSVGNKA